MPSIAFNKHAERALYFVNFTKKTKICGKQSPQSDKITAFKSIEVSDGKKALELL